MFPARIRLFSLLGFRISIDLSWFFLALYLVFSLARYFTQTVPGQTSNVYLTLGVIGALGFFASIVLHELAHAVVARGFGLPVSGITLFIFGGVAELRQEPKTPRSEFWVAIAGPTVSVIIAAVCFAADAALNFGDFNAISALLALWTYVNTVLTLFNLVPAFPLDGGRILRSILWWRTGNLRRATRIASLCGTVFAILLVLLGVAQITAGNTLGGTWQVLIGLFLAGAASQTRNQTGAGERLRGVLVTDLMDRSPITVEPDVTVNALVHDIIYGANRKFVIVAEEGQALGYATPDQIKAVPRSDWDHTFARSVAARFTHDTAVAPSASALEAARKIQSNGVGSVAVLDGNRLLGVVSETSFANYLTVREAFAAAPPAASAAGSMPSRR